MNILILLNDPSYGSERSYNSLRLAETMNSTEAMLTLFLTVDCTLTAETAIVL